MFKQLLFLIFILSLILTIKIYSQNRDVKEEIKKAKEMGYSDQDIAKKAKEMGYSDEDIQSIINSNSASSNYNDAVKRSQAQPKSVIIPNAPKQSSSFKVTAFSERNNASDLSAFGYNIFNYTPTTFEPSASMPAPASYIIGPGDELVISMWGDVQDVQKQTVSNTGDIYIPNAGLVNVSGLTLKGVQNKLSGVLAKVNATLNTSLSGSGTHLDVSTGKLRSVKIYLMGEITKPGGYTLPALSTSFTALYYGGGPSINGSLRNVKVMRRGKTIAEIDLYDYLIEGNRSGDIEVQDEDIIFVPPVGKRVAMSGNVYRPAIYELKINETLRNALNFAGGLNFNAYFERVHVERIIPFEQRKNFQYNILDIDLKFNSVNELRNNNYSLEDGDVVEILGVNARPENKVVISGDVKKPGTYELNKGMTIRDLIYRADNIYPDAFLSKAVLIRTLQNEKKQLITFNLKKALEGNSSDNYTLENRDEVQIFNEETFYPTKKVHIYGAVKSPGEYIRYENMTLSQLIVLAGGLSDSATTKDIEITRLDTISMDVFSQEINFDLPKDYWTINKANDFLLQDFDKVFIKADPAKTFSQNVEIVGEVLYPGNYSILHEGEKLHDLISRSGSFKSTAYKEGIYIYRINKSVKANIGDNLIYASDSVDFSLKTQLKFNKSLSQEYSNRIPIQWDEIENNTNSRYNIKLEAGDKIVVPKDPDVVTIVGEVGLPSTVPYKEGEGLNYYIKQAGGYTENANEGKEVVILPNGKKWKPSGFFLFPDPEILSGSTVYVPMYVEGKSNTWPVIRDIVTVAGSTAVLIISVLSLTK